MKLLTSVSPGRANDNIAAMRANVAESPNTSIRQKPQEISNCDKT